jgi:hypothetical protein
MAQRPFPLLIVFDQNASALAGAFFVALLQATLFMKEK